MSIMANRVMHPSVLWPNRAQDVGKRLPIGQIEPNMLPVPRSTILRYPASGSDGGWLDEGLGKKVNLLA